MSNPEEQTVTLEQAMELAIGHMQNQKLPRWPRWCYRMF